MDRKKIFLFLGIGVFILVFAILFFQKPSEKNVPKPVVPFSTPTPYHAPENKITISGVRMNDFIGNSVKKNSKGDVLFVETSDYQLVYLKQFNQFIISILATPFNTTRARAENDFLGKLGISKEDACRLNTSVNTPHFANPGESGRNYPLSFCENN